MNKNSYVTAALFVVFVLLSVFYIGMDQPNGSTANVGSTSTLPQAQTDITKTDAQSGSELASQTEGEGDVTTSGTESTSMQYLRTELQKQQSQKVSDLKEVIASKDYDAETKSDAKDDLDKINKTKEHQSALETMIKAKGYSDAFVRANEDTVQVIVQVEQELTLEEVNEIYLMAKTEFTNNPDVNIEFQPLN